MTSLAISRVPLCAALQSHSGMKVHWHAWAEYTWCAFYNISIERMLRIIVEDRILETMAPEAHARETLQSARRSGFRIAVVSSRAFHPRGMQLTEDWLSKPFIDDYAKNVSDVAQAAASERVALLDRPWNRHERRFKRICDLHEASEWIERLPREARHIPAPRLLSRIA
jgi:hypothetical protein